MMNNNKILTVSYGTFSCTLEGFDDSFDTMKAIAEYFRDLAADDRYFGAEPPQPDAEMLARIAEREVARRVEAREQDGRILLKAHEETVQEPPAAALAAAALTQPQTPETPAADHAEAPVEEAPEVEATTETDTPDAAAPDAPAEADEVADHAEETPVIAEEVAESEEETEAVAEATDEAAEIEAAEEPVEEENVAEAAEEADLVAEEKIDAVAAGDAEHVPADDTPEDEAQAEDIRAADGIEEDMAEEEVAEEDTTAQDVFAEEMQEQDVALTAEAFFADSPAPSETDAEMEAELEAPAEFAAFDQPASFTVPEVAPQATSESIAAKLQRIREVVSQNDDDSYDEEDSTAAAEPVDILDMPFDMAVQPSEDTSAEAETEADSALNEAAQDIEEAFEVDDQIAAEAEAEPEEDDLSAVLSRLDAEGAAGEDSLLGADEDEVTAEDAEENLFGDHADATEDLTSTAEEAPEDTDAPDAEATAVKGRVLKVDRADLEAALEAGDLEEFDGSDAAVLTAEEEEELQRELDAVAAENAPDEEEEETDKQAARDSLPPIDADAAEDVTRLMAEADQQMEEPEGATRRSAFAHLRAAVAARFADKSMAKEASEEETTKAYRNDLAQVVKPRRPVASGNRTERPADQRPTPLKLVAEQRIDDEALADAGPVTPRRVAATLEDDLEFAEDTGFAEFAEQMGATKLPDVLEAAAAYLAFVEGHEQFSRPQLMTRVRQADCGEFSREDGLRSFGQLLRAGKIEKIKGGRFAASDAIGFKPDERAAS